MSDEAFRWTITIGVGLAALSFVVMGIVAIVVVSLLLKLKAKIDPILESVRPIVQTVNEAATDLKPKVLKISDSAVEVSQVVVKEVQRYSDLSKDVAERAKAQVARIDVAVDHTVDNVQEAGGAVKRAVLRPVQQVDGILSGIRTGISTLTRAQRPSIRTATQDEEMFI